MTLGGKSAKSKEQPEEVVKAWEKRKREVYKQQARRHMARAVAGAQKKEGAHTERIRKAKQAAKKR
jgi:hypothetical protein